MVQPSLDERLSRETAHGATESAVRQAEFGWSSAAGKIRAQRRFEFVVDGIPVNARVLEVGAGTGLQTKNLLTRFRDIDAIDISPDLLRFAESRAPGARYAVMDAHEPDFPDETFDAIIGISILHHLDWDLALQSFFRKLRPGGRLRFSEPNMCNPQIFLQKNIPYLKRLAGDSPDETAFTTWQIRRALTRAGFVEPKATPFEFLHPGTPESWIPGVLAVERLLHKSPLRAIGGSLLIEARKPLRSDVTKSA